MFDDHYIDWRISRMNGIKKYVNPDIINNSSLLELGCGYGDNGNIFSSLFNCKVTCTDAREEHINIGKEKYTNIEFNLLDSDTTKINKHYDIILHWGLLYHLENFEDNLNNCCDNCNYMFLETEVCDSSSDNIIKINENGYDQAFHNIGTRVSESYIEKILLQNNFNFKMIKDNILNSSFHKYDWDISNTHEWSPGLRRYWICWKNDQISPLL